MTVFIIGARLRASTSELLSYCCYNTPEMVHLIICVILITQLLWLVGNWNHVNRFNHTILMTVVTPTDRPKSVRNRCVIEAFCGVLCCHVAFWNCLWV